MNDWESKPDDYNNFEKWQITRYWNTRNRYMLTARHEFGYQLKEYCDKGKWEGGTEKENRIYEQLQDYYIQNRSEGIKITRNNLMPRVKLFEVNQDNVPILGVLVVDGRVLHSEKHTIKDGYRYRF
jgi:hypothetical protein